MKTGLNRSLTQFCKILLTASLVSTASSEVVFDYVLDSAGQTSGAVYLEDGTLLKTLWSNQTKSAGEQAPVEWDGFDDDGNEYGSDTVHLRVIKHNITYQWEGVVGNTGDDQTSDSKPRAFRPMKDLDFSPTGEGFAAPDYNEAQSSAVRFDQDSGNKWARALPPDYRFATQAIAADSTNIYFARNPGSSPESFLFKKLIYKRDWQDPDGWFTEHAVTMETKLGNSVQNVINPGTERCYGLAVQKEGTLLAASYFTLDIIRVFNKTSGEHLFDLEITGPRKISFDENGHLWVIAGPSDDDGAVFVFETVEEGASPELALDTLSNPLDLAFTPDGSKLLLIDAGENHQVFAFDPSSKELLWALGQKGGYVSNGPSVHFDKFHFINTHFGFEESFITCSPNGNIWVGDMGNFRTLVFSPERELVEEIMYIPHNYLAAADLSDPTRVFCGWLEFEIDYAKPLEEGWRLSRNWVGNVPLEWQKNNGIHTVVTVDTVSGPVTLAVADLPRSGRWIHRAIAKLDPDEGIIDTGLDCKSAMAIYAGGTLREWYDVKGEEYQVIEEKAFLGLDGEHNPVWGEAAVIARAPKGPQDPYFKNAFSSRSGSRWPVTDSGKVIFFDQGKRNIDENPGFHLGAIERGGSDWKWRASYSGQFDTIWGPDYTFEERGRVVNPTGAYDDATSHQYGGNRVMTVDNHIVYGYHGEFWNNAQANQWLHFTEDGLFVGQFGHPSYPWKSYPFEGVMGNAFSPEMVSYESDIYLYMNDESVHGGIHRWKMEGLETLQHIEVQPTERTLAISGNLDFGDVVTGVTESRELSLSNTGNATLNVSSVSFPAGFSGAWSGSIAPGASQDIAVTFNPSEERSYNGFVNVSSDMLSGNSSINISGRGTAPPQPSFPDNWPVFSEWIASYTLTVTEAHENADPDGDGFTNIVEYIYGRDPTTFEKTPPISWSFINPPTEGANIRFTEQAVHLPRTIDWHFKYHVGSPSAFIRVPKAESPIESTQTDYSVTDYLFDPLDGSTEIYAEPILSNR